MACTSSNTAPRRHLTVFATMSPMDIEPSWKHALREQVTLPYFTALSEFIDREYSTHAAYPSHANIFRAFDACPFDRVRVVIIGQDPYHGPGQANGLSFAVQSGTPLPPSLKNMFKEIASDIPAAATAAVKSDEADAATDARDGDLSRWAAQGVLLLNAILTVRMHNPGSHQKKGWEQYTDAVIDALSAEREHLVFLLWGNYAKQKGARIDRRKHLVLEAAHPSPLSAHSGFFGCKHFSKTNQYLQDHGLTPIDWR